MKAAPRPQSRWCVVFFVLVIAFPPAGASAGQPRLLSEEQRTWLIGIWDRMSPQYARFTRTPTPAFAVEAKQEINFYYDSKIHTVKVTTPAVALFNGQEGEVAFFLGHELGHALVLREPRSSGVLLEFLRALYYWPKGKKAPLSKKESESLPDMWGLCLMSAAGFNPTDAGAAFGRLGSVAGTGYEGRVTWLDVHPSDQRRISIIHRAMKQGLVQHCQRLR